MMQHAAGVDRVEPALERPQFENVGLRIFDLPEAQFPGFAYCVGEARAAEVDREDARMGKTPGDFHRMPAGAAAGDEHFALASGVGKRDGRKAEAQIAADGLLRRLRRRLDPARIGVFLVLLPDRGRDGVRNGGEPRDRLGDIALRPRLANLLGNDARKRRGPIPLQQQIGDGQAAERAIACEGGEPQRRDRAARRTLGDHDLPRLFGFVRLLRRQREYIVIEKTLAGERAPDGEQAFVGVVGLRGRGDQRPQHRQEAFEGEIADGVRFQEPAQEGVVGEHAKAGGSEQRVDPQSIRPRLRRPRNGALYVREELKEGRENIAVRFVQFRCERERPLKMHRRFVAPPLRQ